MPGQQLTLDLSSHSGRRRSGPRLAARMISILAARRTWLTRAELAAFGLTDRQCRLGRQHAHGRILRGRQGYKLMRYATAEEIRQSSAAWTAQIAAEQHEHALMMRRAHEALHARGLT